MVTHIITTRRRSLSGRLSDPISSLCCTAHASRVAEREGARFPLAHEHSATTTNGFYQVTVQRVDWPTTVCDYCDTRTADDVFGAIGK